jgi:hypothetical protein
MGYPQKTTNIIFLVLGWLAGWLAEKTKSAEPPHSTLIGSSENTLVITLHPDGTALHNLVSEKAKQAIKNDENHIQPILKLVNPLSFDSADLQLGPVYFP